MERLKAMLGVQREAKEPAAPAAVPKAAAPKPAPPPAQPVLVVPQHTKAVRSSLRHACSAHKWDRRSNPTIPFTLIPQSVITFHVRASFLVPHAHHRLKKAPAATMLQRTTMQQLKNNILFEITDFFSPQECDFSACSFRSFSATHVSCNVSDKGV